MFLMNKLMFGILAVPFVVIILIPTLVVIAYFIYLVIITIKYKAKLGLRDLQTLLIDETTIIPDYEPAVMGYLVNCQKIGRRELCSTLFDLIGRNVIKITLRKGFVSDDDAKYVLELDQEKTENLNGFETRLVKYLFGSNKKIKSETLHKKLYKKNLKENFYDDFLKLVQSKAKTHDFFDAKTAKRKIRVYKIIDKIVTIIASISSFLAMGVMEIDDFDEYGFIVTIVVLSLITAGILWCLKFLITFMFNLSCFYNDFSEKGNEDYKKWMGFRKYLKNYSTLPDHPLMGIMVWERYYAYAIGLKCSKKFFKQMKKMKVVDNSIDVDILETLNDIVSCIGTSTKKMKKLSLDEYGGVHVDY